MTPMDNDALRLFVLSLGALLLAWAKERVTQWVKGKMPDWLRNLIPVLHSVAAAGVATLAAVPLRELTLEADNTEMFLAAAGSVVAARLMHKTRALNARKGR